MSGSVGFSPIDLYQQYAANESTYANNALKANPQDQSLVAYFNANAASITSPQQLLGNYKLLTVVLTAFNLQGAIKDTALLKQLMTQDPTKSTSLAQRLQNSSYLLFAKAMSSWPVNVAFNSTLTIKSFSPQAAGIANTDAAFQIATGTGSSAHTYAFEFTDNGQATPTPLQSTQNASTTVVSVPINSTTNSTGQALSQLVTALQKNGFGITQNQDGSLSISGNDIQSAKFGTVSGGTFTAEPAINGIGSKGITVTAASPFADASARAQLIQSYTTNTFEQSANQQAPGLADALYFTRQMPNIKSIAALQSDSNLLQVAVATTGITYDQYAMLDFNQQTDLLTKALKTNQFQTPSYVKQVAEQYLIQQSSNGTSAPPDPGSVASLFSDTTTDTSDTMLNILDPGANLGSNDSGGGSVLSLFA